MIENANILINEDFLHLLIIPKTFYVTGSHYFGGASKDSDYDFFVQEDAEIASVLQELGYELIGHSDYLNDESIVRVYEKLTHDRIANAKRKIQIQLVKDAKKKYEVQKFLKRHFPARLPGIKTERSALWNMAFLAYETWVANQEAQNAMSDSQSEASKADASPRPVSDPVMSF